MKLLAFFAATILLLFSCDTGMIIDNSTANPLANEPSSSDTSATSTDNYEPAKLAVVDTDEVSESTGTFSLGDMDCTLVFSEDGKSGVLESSGTELGTFSFDGENLTLEINGEAIGFILKNVNGSYYLINSSSPQNSNGNSLVGKWTWKNGTPEGFFDYYQFEKNGVFEYSISNKIGDANTTWKADKGIVTVYDATGKVFCTDDGTECIFIYDGENLFPEVYPLTLTYVEEKPETVNYNNEAEETLSEVSKETGGITMYSATPSDLAGKIKKILSKINNSFNTEIVFAIDATGSMSNDIAQLRSDLWACLQEKATKLGTNTFRIGLLLYKDYGDSYNYKNLPVNFFDFTTNLDTFKTNFYSFEINGGGSGVDEAVYEALYASLEFYNWSSPQKRVILIGDAPPHTTPLGTGQYTKDLVLSKAKSKKIPVDCIILPQ